MFGRWLMPRKWLLPSAMAEWKNDSGVLSYKNDSDKMEISLNTSGYSPSELSVNVGDGELVISGVHEERSGAGDVMVSRQFRRQYALGQDVDTSKVVSNLSQDGVLVVTMPKDNKIQEIKEEKKNLQRGIDETDKKINSPSSTMSSSKSSSSTRFSSKTESRNEDKPMQATLHSDSLKLMEQSQNDFFEKSRKHFEENMKKMHENMENFSKEMKIFDEDWMKMPALSKMSFEDNHELSVVDDEDKLEIRLDTVGYKPDELKVLVGEGVVSVEGRHEERTENGDRVMLSRQMKRQYPLPAGAVHETVNSNLSKDGVLIITIPKATLMGEHKW